MNTMPSPSERRQAATPLQRRLTVFAVVVAISLLSLYVQVLHASVARADGLREGQRTAPNRASPNKSMTTMQLGRTGPRPNAERADARGR